MNHPRPDAPQRSGRLLLRLPAELHTRAAHEAAACGKSLNRWLLEVLASSLTGDEPPVQPPADRAPWRS